METFCALSLSRPKTTGRVPLACLCSHRSLTPVYSACLRRLPSTQPSHHRGIVTVACTWGSAFPTVKAKVDGSPFAGVHLRWPSTGPEGAFLKTLNLEPRVTGGCRRWHPTQAAAAKRDSCPSASWPPCFLLSYKSGPSAFLRCCGKPFVAKKGGVPVAYSPQR